jgi:hypothetical protein
MMDTSHYIVMFFIMILSGILSTMNMWADKTDDLRLSLNDIYMVLLMTGWMFLFMGFFYMNWAASLFGAALTVASLWCIRTQFMISPQQYLQGMIPHHSMAVHMSRKLIAQNTSLATFAAGILNQQELEIDYMKRLL